MYRFDNSLTGSSAKHPGGEATVFYRIVLCSFVFMFLAASGPTQRILRVPGEYKSIQGAIDAALTADTVLVAPGTYKEAIDFKGKGVAVVSERGPDVTVIDGNGANSVVQFNSAEPSQAALRGFTVTGGRHGISCSSWSRVSIADNRVTANRETGIATGSLAWIHGNTISRNARGVYATGQEVIEGNVIEDNVLVTSGMMGGAGIYATGAHTIRDNTIRNNKVVGAFFGGGLALSMRAGIVEGNFVQGNELQYVSPAPSVFGGGMYGGGSSSVLVRNNHFIGNRLTGGGSLYQYGGGVFIGACVFTNNNVMGNTAGFGGGIGTMGLPYGSCTTIVNSIVRDNSGSQIASYGTPVLYVSHCNVSGGFQGAGNIDKDPLFVPGDSGPYHLRADSPCVDGGNDRLVPISTTDFEGDPRVANGAVDIGADELYPHLYHTGDARPGNSIQIRFVGPPGQMVIWAFSTSGSLLEPPLSIPGLQGGLRLEFPFFPIPIAVLPKEGFCSFPLEFAPWFPAPSAYATQAVVGLRLSNAEVIRVLP